VNISLPFAKFNAFHRTNIIQLTTSVSSKLNIVCIKCKVKNHWYLQQRCPNSYMHRVEFYSHVKTKFAWSRLLLRWDYMFTTTSLTPQQLIKVPVQCHNSARPCTCIYIYTIRFWKCSDSVVFYYFHILTPFHYTPPVKVGLFHTMKDISIYHITVILKKIFIIMKYICIHLTLRWPLTPLQLTLEWNLD
jgi:hypothetical protein